MAATASLVVLVAAIRLANAIPCPNKAVLFYHLPKTGGSTFTHLFRPGSSHFVSARSYADAQSALRGLRDCDERAKEARGWFLLEVHPIAFLPHEALWLDAKESLRSKGVPVFATGFLRDPVDHALSVYNWCCGQESAQRQNCGLGPRSPAQLVSALGKNLQCTNIVEGWHGQRGTRTSFTVDTCISAFARYRDAMDSVGVTSRLEATIAAVETFLNVSVNAATERPGIITGAGRTGPTYVAEKHNKIYPQRADLSDSDLEKIVLAQRLDFAMYQALELGVNGSMALFGRTVACGSA